MNDGAAPAPTPLQAYRRLLSYARPYWPLLVMAAFGMVIEAAAAGAFTAMMKPVVNETFINKNRNTSSLLPLAIVAIFLVRGLATLSTDYGMARAARSIVRDLREAMLAKYLRLPSTAFDLAPVPQLVSRLNYDTEQVTQASTEALKVMVTDTLLIIAMLAVMIWNSPKVTLSMLIMAPLIAGIIRTVSARYRRLNRGIQDGVADMAQSAEQTLSGHQEVRIYGARDAELARYNKLANRNLRLNVKVELTRGISSSLVQTVGAVALALILFLAGHEAVAGRMNAGQFVSLMLSMMGLIPSLRRTTNVQSAVQRGIAACQHIFALLDAPEERDEGKRPLNRARGEIAFENVGLRYHGQSDAALTTISFVARPGTVTAIVGRSGSGKTSLVRLIPRFYEPDVGRILLDGMPLSEYSLADLRRQVALVGQRVMLFDDTLAANIAYGEQAGASAEAINAAAMAANAQEFIERMPQGINSRIGENGGLLSGGQRQRLAIARAILKDAPVLILDEATAALDNESERLVQDALNHLIPDRTTLVIAHRLSTIEHADQVLVLDAGRLVEKGTHAELLAQGGIYAHLHRMQFRESATS
jgi:subfamily B ATP-binding cassette protein MsbA